MVSYLFIAGLTFVVWKFTFWNITGMNSLLLNILGFMVMSFGLILFKMEPNESEATSNKESHKTVPNNSQKKESEVEPEPYKTTDYSKYMPKQETDSSETEKD